MHTITHPYVDEPIDISRLITCARGFLEHATQTRIRIVSNPNPNPAVDAVALLRCAARVLRIRTRLLIALHLPHLSATDKEKDELSRCEEALGQAHTHLFQLSSLLVPAMASPTSLH
jgi:hypothetical protein